MATITLYKDKVNGVGSLLDDIIKSVNNLDVQLGTLKTTLQGVDSSTCDLQDTVDSISSSSKSEKEKIDDLKKLNNKLTDFIETTTNRDNSARDEINRQKDDFYTKYKYLKPECEKSRTEKFIESLKKVCDWCKEHWKLIATIVIVAVSIAVLLIPGVGPIIAGACWGAILGAVIGGVSGGLESMANGGSFLKGFEDGAFSGAISGAISGAAFAGIGQLGAAAGNGLNALKNGAACTSKLGKFIKGTAAVTKVMDTAMGGFDMLAMADKYFGSGHIAAFNEKLHNNKAYNFFQNGVSVTAAFTGGMTTTMTCFVAGTYVLTKNGRVAIERIKPDDIVLSKDPKTNTIAYKRVLKTIQRKVDRLIHLTVGDEEIITTFDHPFFVQGKGFVKAAELWIGAEFITSQGETVVIDDIFREFFESDSQDVFNFEVEDYHTYFVGNLDIWVHNAECTITFTNKSGLDEKEFKQQLKDQQKGMGDLTIDEYQKNRAAYNQRKSQTGSGRDPSSAKYQTQAKKEAISTKAKEFMKQGKSPSEAKKLAKEWAKGKAALHGPDQIAGGRADNITGLGDSRINSSIGSQWKNNVAKLDQFISDKAATMPKNTKLSELGIEFVLS